MDLSDSAWGDAPRRSGLGISMRSRHPAIGGCHGRVAVLEASDQSLDALLPSLSEDFDVALVHAPRRADPRSYGRPLKHGHWFVGPPDSPDPLGLFSALEALEALIATPSDSLPSLVGSGAGATLSLALASYWGDRLHAVVAIGGVVPTLPDEIEPAEIRNLPILSIPEAGPSESTGRCDSLDALEKRGAALNRRPRASLVDAPESIARWLRDCRGTQS